MKVTELAPAKLNLTLEVGEKQADGSFLQTVSYDEQLQLADVGTLSSPGAIFKGWSTSKIAATIIDPTKYKPNGNMTLFAWFEYNTSTTALAYYATCLSSTNKAVEG